MKKRRTIPPTGAVYVDYSMEIRPLKWLIEGILPAQGRAVVYGAPKTGKSFLGIHMACCISAGEPFMGRVASKAPVLYMAFEDAPGIAMRFAVSIRNVPHGKIILKNNLVPFSRPGVGEEDAIVSMIQDIQRDHPEAPNLGLIIIDTVARSMVGSENDGEDWAYYQSCVDALMRAFPKASVLLIHHENKAEVPSLRGHTSLPANMDAILRVKKSKQSSVLVVEGMKNAASGYSFTFTLDDIQAMVPIGNGAYQLESTKIPVFVSSTAPTASAVSGVVVKTKRHRVLGIIHRLGGKADRTAVRHLLARELKIDLSDKQARKNHGRMYLDIIDIAMNAGELVSDGSDLRLTDKGKHIGKEMSRQSQGHLNGKAEDRPIRPQEPEAREA